MARCPTCLNDFDTAVFCPTDGARLVDGNASGGDRTGQIIETRYRLLRMVGRGGMGEVYEAEHIYINKRVALKLLHAHLVANTEAVHRLHREARSTSGIGHPNIVHIEDFGHTKDGAVYLAMEWLDGETLRERLARGPLPIPDALAIMSDIAGGVAASHASGVIHRDLKPANIFLSRVRGGAEVVKVLDFGIAKLASGDSELTRTGAFIGTPHYMAPEQEQAHDVDARSDVYSMGVVLYELACGTIPFGGESVIAVLHQHASKAPEPPRQRAPDRDISEELERVILTALAKKPDDRYQNALAFKGAVDALRSESGVAPRRITDRGVVAQAGSSESQPVAPQPVAPTIPPPQQTPTMQPPPQAPTTQPPPQPLPEDSLGFDVPGGRRRVGPVIVGGLLLAGLAGAGAYLLLRGSGDDTAASPSGDAGAVVVNVPADATPAVVRSDAAPHVREAWTLHAKTKGTGFEVTTTPPVLRPGEPFELRIEIDHPSRAVTHALAEGHAQVVFHYVYYKGHTKFVSEARDIDANGVMSEPDRRDLGKAGKYHVRAVLGHGKKTVWTGRFDICVGADPEGPRAELDALCPRLNGKH